MFGGSRFTNVTAAYCVEGFTPDHLAALLRNGVTRVLIAYDRDEAGDGAVVKLAAQLIEQGIECYRIVFTRTMDATATALHAGRSAANSLGMAICKAQWLGMAPRDPLLSLAARQHLPDATPPQAPTPIARAAEPPPEVVDNTLRMTFGERYNLVRGLEKNTSPEQLKINLLAAHASIFTSTPSTCTPRGRAPPS